MNLFSSKNNSILNNEDLLKDRVKNSFTYSEVLRKFDLKITGGNVKSLKKYINFFKIDVSHFHKTLYKRKLVKNTLSIQDILCKDSNYHTEKAKSFILSNNLIKYECAGCGNQGEWRGKSITLQLEHKNGNNRDHRLDNLEFLCPNCHSQTATYGSKNRKSYQQKNKIKFSYKYIYPDIDISLDKIADDIINNQLVKFSDIFLNYKIIFTRTRKRYILNKLKEINNSVINDFLFKNEPKKISYPLIPELIKMIETKGYLQSSKIIGCSDNAIRKYLKKNGIKI